MNKVILQGRLTSDIEVTEYGKSKDKNLLANFTLAVRDTLKDEDGEYITQFIRCTIFGKGAEVLEQFTEKGMPLVICGKLRNSVYEDKDGVKHYNTNVIVDDFDLIVSKKSTDNETPRKKAKR